MKNLLRYITLTMLLVSGLHFEAVAQDNQMYGPEWGENATPLERRNNVLTFNLYREAYNSGDYEKAAGYLNDLLEKAPAGAQNIYVMGINMMKKMFTGETDALRRKELADSAAMLYNMRLEYFSADPKYGKQYIMKQRAKDFALLFPADRKLVNDAYRDAVAANPESPDAEIYVLWFREITDVDFKEYGMDDAGYAENYANIVESLRNIDGAEEAVREVEDLFLKSGLSGKDNIERIISERISKAELSGSKEYLYSELLACLSLMETLDYKGEYYVTTARMLYEIAPDTNIASTLALYYRNADDRVMSVKMWLAAAEIADTPQKQAAFITLAASDKLESKEYVQAETLAKKSMLLDSGQQYFNYMIIAQSYAGQAVSGSGDPFARKSVFWLAADMLDKATAAANDDAQRSQARKLKEDYALNYPTGEEIFYKGLREGDGYEVNYGSVKGSTTVRAR